MLVSRREWIEADMIAGPSLAAAASRLSRRRRYVRQPSVCDQHRGPVDGALLSQSPFRNRHFFQDEYGNGSDVRLTHVIGAPVRLSLPFVLDFESALSRGVHPKRAACSRSVAERNG